MDLFLTSSNKDECIDGAELCPVSLISKPLSFSDAALDQFSLFYTIKEKSILSFLWIFVRDLSDPQFGKNFVDCKTAMAGETLKKLFDVLQQERWKENQTFRTKNRKYAKRMETERKMKKDVQDYLLLIET